MSNSLEELVPRVYRFALRLTRDRHEAEDLAQETFLRGWGHRAALRDPAAARTWLFGIAVNLWRSRLRRRRTARQGLESSEEAGLGRVRLPDQDAIAREDVARVLQAMDALPDRQREVLYLHACEALSLPQIAEVLGIHPGAVKASLSLARKRLRRQLKDLDCLRRVCGNETSP